MRHSFDMVQSSIIILYPHHPSSARSLATGTCVLYIYTCTCDIIPDLPTKKNGDLAIAQSSSNPKCSADSKRSTCVCSAAHLSVTHELWSLHNLHTHARIVLTNVHRIDLRFDFVIGSPVGSYNMYIYAHISAPMHICKQHACTHTHKKRCRSHDREPTDHLIHNERLVFVRRSCGCESAVALSCAGLTAACARVHTQPCVCVPWSSAAVAPSADKQSARIYVYK